MGSACGSWSASAAGGNRLRQLLVTRSPKLCLAIRNSIKLALGTQAMLAAGEAASASPASAPAAAAGIVTDLLLLDEEEEARLHGDLPSRLLDVPDAHCPLVLTYRQFESMLDCSLPVPFLMSLGGGAAQRQAAGRAAVAARGSSASPSDSDADDDDNNSGGWEGFSDDGSDDSGDELGQTSHPDVTRPAASPATLEVDYDRFEAKYWPHLNAAARRGLDASLLWTEMQSSMKGGLEALGTTRGRMDEGGYVALADRYEPVASSHALPFLGSLLYVGVLSSVADGLAPDLVECP